MPGKGRSLVLQRVLGGAIVAGACLALFALVSVRDQARLPPEQVPQERAELLALLTEYRRVRKPEDREALLLRARAELPRCERAVAWLLGQPSHPLLRPALQLFGELRLQAALPGVEALASVAALRREALLCADRIAPFDPGRVLALLEGADRAAILAGAEIARRRDERPTPALLQLLAHQDAEVRLAAFAALPDQVPADAVPPLLQLAGADSPAIAELALQALGRAPIEGATEQFLAHTALRAEAALVRAALDALTRRGKPLSPEAAGPLWQLAYDGADATLRAAAYQCLERTGSYELEDAERQVFGGGLVDRYFAARMLITRGEQAGVTVLLDLVQQLEPNTDGKYVRFACATLLGSLSNMHASSSVTEWEQWFAANPLQGPRSLPPPPPGIFDAMQVAGPPR